MNQGIMQVCEEQSAYGPRRDTDVLFQLPAGAAAYHGMLDRTIRLVEQVQLLDRPLWKLFADQFRGTPDDEDKGWRSEYWGKMMRGACYTYQYTQNEILYQVMEETVRDLLAAQDAQGRITTYSVEEEFQGWDVWGRKYVLLGLQYFLEVCKEPGLKQKIMDAMKAHASYILEKLGPARDGKKPLNKTSDFWLGINSCSILEPIVRLYHLTGEEKYLDFATYIVEEAARDAGNIFELAYEGKRYPYQYPVVKAYEMMSCFEGLLEYYRVTGIEKWKTAVIHFARLVQESDITVIGCAGCTHELFDHSTVKQTTKLYDGIMQETCVTVTWMKFCYQVLCLTGESWLADEIESSVYNALLGAVNTQGNTQNGGLPFDSYSPLLNSTRGRAVGGKKSIAPDRFYGCCAAIGAAGTGLIPMVSAMQKEEGVAINLYLPGRISFFTPLGQRGWIEVETDYPKEGAIVCKLELEDTEAFQVSLRIPAWSKQTALAVNGQEVACGPGSYAVLKQTWKSGDIITLNLDLRCRVLAAPDNPEEPDSKLYRALQRGPVVLARDARLGERIEEPVRMLRAADNTVEVLPSEVARFPHEQEYEVPLEGGGSIHVIDYASAGKTWEEDSRTTVWMLEPQA